MVLAYNIIRLQYFFWIGGSLLFTVSVFGERFHINLGLPEHNLSNLNKSESIAPASKHQVCSVEPRPHTNWISWHGARNELGLGYAGSHSV